MSTLTFPCSPGILKGVTPAALGPHRLSEAVVLAGAGISRGYPTVAPSGEGLSKLVFDALAVNSLPVPADDIEWIRNEVESLRLELFLELLATEIPASALHRVYRVLAGRPPNSNHLALVALNPQAMLTTNQDLCLEEAAMRLGRQLPVDTVLHLHGRWDRPRSIVTMLSQYTRGMRPAQRHMMSKVRGRHVVVMGYSGRDRDVMTALVRAGPAEVTWLIHPEGMQCMSVEMVAAWRRLTADRMTFAMADANEWLECRLPDAERRLLADKVAGIAEADCPALDDNVFADVSALQRSLALARVLNHGGQHNEAADCYTRTIRILGNHPRARLGLGIAFISAGKRQRAFRELHQVQESPDVDRPTQASAILWEVQGFREVGNYKAAVARLAKLEALGEGASNGEERALTHARAWGLSHQAGIARIEGRLRESEVGYRRAGELFRRLGETDGVIGATTWRAELACLRGEFRRAKSLAARAADEATLFSPKATIAWPPWVAAVADSGLGSFGAALRGFRSVCAQFERTPNAEGILWSVLEIANVGRLAQDEEHLAADMALKHALELSEGVSRRNRPAIARLYLISADQARLSGNMAEMRQCLKRVYAIARAVEFTQPLRYLELYGRLIEVEATRTVKPSRSVVDFRALACRFESIAFFAYAERCRVAADSVEGKHDDRVLERNRRKGWAKSVVHFGASGGGPILFI